MPSDCMLTTIDNPFDPCEQFEDWYAFDTQKGYYTCQYLARIARVSFGLSDYDNAKEIESAMNQICSLNPSLYKIVYKTNKEKLDSNSE